MDSPVALKLVDLAPPIVHRVRIEPVQVDQAMRSDGGWTPAIVVTRSAAILPEMSAGVIDKAEIVAVADGDWNDAVLVVLPSLPRTSDVRTSDMVEGDEAFLAEVSQNAPNLIDLARETIAAIRAAGVEGKLVKSQLGRWVNHPINSFTLKAQPRVANIHFTIYGNPRTYDEGDFLRQDQNSYSRGWVHRPSDIKRLAGLARQAYVRRKS